MSGCVNTSIAIARPINMGHLSFATCTPGHLPALLSSRAPLILADWAAACGPVMRLRLLNSPVVIVSDPVEGAKLLKKGPSYLPKARQLYAALEAGVEPRCGGGAAC